ncbi:MAG TPA: hypothetical protein VFG14_18275 [Chthoniobacteraceae bacterium]|nr:hypothetical protein [Chthoniobacteraceae bacterium]
MNADAPGSLTAYFEGDLLREALLKLTPARENAVRRLDRTLSSNVRFIRAEIVSIHRTGALVSVRSYSSEELKEDSPSPIEHPFFVYGLPEGVVAGAKWEGRVYPAGQYHYITSDKAAQSINAVAVTKEWAIRAMETADGKDRK